jgi:peptide/nickel transport system permease protein
VSVTRAEGAVEVIAGRVPRARAVWARLGRALVRRPLGTAGGLLIALLVVIALCAPLLAPYDPEVGDFLAPSEPPSAAHPFGTDGTGRDVLSRVLFGARISLQVGVIAVTIGTVLGSAIGLLSGYLGGWVDAVLQRLLEVVQAFPGLVLALVLVAALGPAIRNVMVAVGIAASPALARVVRGSVLAVKQNPYVEAARAVGATGPRVVLWHILPNVTAPIIVVATAGLGSAILVEASLSYLGLGAPPPAPSWGSMLNESRLAVGSAWWGAVFPGVAISLAVFGFNLLGDALRDAWDPRLRGTR